MTAEPLVLWGMPAIADFVGMPADFLSRRDDLPTFSVGDEVCARPDALRAWVMMTERRTSGRAAYHKGFGAGRASK